MVYNPVLLFAELSILLRYIVPNHRSSSLFLVYSIVFTNAFSYMAVILSLIFVCSPREKAWMLLIPGHCTKVEILLITGAAFKVILDLVILLLPVALLWRLRIPNKQKLKVWQSMPLGYFAFISLTKPPLS